jgi:hypothetical protein
MAIKLIHIMLLIHLPLSPSKGIYQFNGPHSILTSLKVIEYSLNAKWDALVIVNIGWHFIDCSSECSDDE